MKLFLCLVFFATAFAQQAVRDTPLGCPSNAACVTLLDYSSTYLIYVGNAQQYLPTNSNCATSAGVNVGNTCQKRTNSTLTNIVVLTNVGTVTTATAHGAYIGMRVKIFGATVDTDLNGDYTIATVPSSTTYTIATVSVANATYTESTLVVSTVNPLTTALLWGLSSLKYDGSNNLITTDYFGQVAWSARAAY